MAPLLFSLSSTTRYIQSCFYSTSNHIVKNVGVHKLNILTSACQMNRFLKHGGKIIQHSWIKNKYFRWIINSLSIAPTGIKTFFLIESIVSPRSNVGLDLGLFSFGTICRGIPVTFYFWSVAYNILFFLHEKVIFDSYNLHFNEGCDVTIWVDLKVITFPKHFYICGSSLIFVLDNNPNFGSFQKLPFHMIVFTLKSQLLVKDSV